jgi:hypothetical protein
MEVSLSEVRCEARVPPDHSSGCGTCERLREQRYGVADPVRQYVCTAEGTGQVVKETGKGRSTASKPLFESHGGPIEVALSQIHIAAGPRGVG